MNGEAALGRYEAMNPSADLGQADAEAQRQADRAAFLLDVAGVDRRDLESDDERFIDWLSAQGDETTERAAAFVLRVKGETKNAFVEKLSYHEACPSCGADERRLYRLAPPGERPQLGTPEAAAEVLVPLLAGLDREHCLLASLDVRHRLIAVSAASIGTVDHTFIAPRELLRDALLHGAAAIVIAHNHPSGDPEPSPDDRLVTRRLAQAGTTVGIQVLDHLVIADREWVSLAREGVI